MSDTSCYCSCGSAEAGLNLCDLGPALPHVAVALAPEPAGVPISLAVAAAHGLEADVAVPTVARARP